SRRNTPAMSASSAANASWVTEDKADSRSAAAITFTATARSDAFSASAAAARASAAAKASDPVPTAASRPDQSIYLPKINPSTVAPHRRYGTDLLVLRTIDPSERPD